MAFWRERSADAAAVEGLVGLGLSPLQARLLAVRGVSAATLEGFLHPSMADLASPTDLPGVDEAAKAVLRAVCLGRKIVVFGDYDCDGICAAAILVNALAAVGASAVAFIPERLSEGYGMSDAAVERMLREHPDVGLVVTVDNGINSVEQVERLRERGVDAVVTDHHLPGEEVPRCPVVNPKLSSPPHLEALCGAGVALMLAFALVRAAKEAGMYSGPKIGGPLFVLAGIATVTDIMPITGQNRILVHEALRLFRQCAPIGLRELLDRASRSASANLTSRDFGFLIGPRINAAGRVASGMEALSLVLADDRELARELARKVDVYNAERKSIEQGMTDAAAAQIVPGAPAQVVNIENGHQGVAGIVASRLLERLGPENAVPVCVVVGGHGSARAPEGYNVRDAFACASEALVAFGGHAAAGGFSVKEGALERFRELFSAECVRQASAIPAHARAAIAVDAEVDCGDLTLDFARWLQTLEPFGEGNPQPTFAMRGATIADARPLGQDGRHLQLTVRRAGMMRGVWWNHGDVVEEVRSASSDRYDIVFSVDVSSYGDPHPEFRVVSMSRTED